MTDTITLPREVVKLALEAFEAVMPFSTTQRELKIRAVEALRTALAAEQPKQEPGLVEGLAELARQMKPLDADMAAILHDNLDSLYIEDEPAIAAPRPEPDDSIPLHKSDCALLIGGYQCTCEFHQRNSKTPPALTAEQPKPEPVGWHYQNSAGYSIVHWRPSARLDADMQAAKDYPNTHKVTPLYTAPPDAEALRRDAEKWRKAQAKYIAWQKGGKAEAMEDKT